MLIMNSILNIFSVTICLALSTNAFANCCVGQDLQDEEDQKFVLVITLDAERVNSLLVNRALKTKVNPKLINKIEAIRFQNPTSFLDEPIYIESNTDKQNRALATIVDQTVIDRLEYQPVEMKIYDSNFSSVVVVLDQPRKNAIQSIPGQLTEPPKGPNDSKPFFVRITSRRGISGTLKNMKVMEIATDFGDVKLPLDQVQGIRFKPIEGNNESSNVFVVLANGDTLSGTVRLGSFVIKSRWGEKELMVRDIESLTTNPSLQFVAKENATDRWVLIDRNQKQSSR